VQVQLADLQVQYPPLLLLAPLLRYSIRKVNKNKNKKNIERINYGSYGCNHRLGLYYDGGRNRTFGSRKVHRES